MEKLLLFTFLMLTCYAYARISVMYAHDKLSDIIAEQCLNEMYPKNKRVEIQESDEPCIIYCVLKKFGIMSNTGSINLEIYRSRASNHSESISQCFLYVPKPPKKCDPTPCGLLSFCLARLLKNCLKVVTLTDTGLFWGNVSKLRTSLTKGPLLMTTEEPVWRAPRPLNTSKMFVKKPKSSTTAHIYIEFF